jgi:hypothetical protein
MSDGTDETASIDLSIAFFCTVLVLFVFVAFQPEALPEDPKRQTIGQTEWTRTVQTPGWNAVAERGGFALMSGEMLQILDMDYIGAGIRKPGSIENSARASQSFFAGKGAVLNEFSLSVTLTPGDLPEGIIRASVSMDRDGECPGGGARLLTVWAMTKVPDLNPLLEFAKRCGRKLRLESPLKPASDGTVTLRIALRPGDYTAESMFR